MTRLRQTLKALPFQILMIATLAAFAAPAFANSVTLSWDANTEADLAGYKVYYGTASRTYGAPITIGKVTTHTLSGLPSGMVYFAVTAYNTAGLESGFSNEVSKSFGSTPAPLVISNVASSGITQTAATITWSTSAAADSQVEYGTTAAYGSLSALGTSYVTSHSRALSGLVAGTTYHYRVRSRDAAGNVALSGNFTFTTAAAPGGTETLTITNVAISNGNTTATFTWTTNRPADSQVEYGTTSALGTLSAKNTTLVTSHSRTLSGLTEGTTYHYRVRSADASGSQAASSVFTFTTTGSSDKTPPVISKVAASGITAGGATITWTTNEAADSQVEFGATTAYGSFSEVGPVGSISHARTLTGLKGNTTYNYRVRSRDAAGNLGQSGNFTFKTPAGQEEPELSISNLAASANVVTATITWTTNRPADSRVEFGTTFDLGSTPQSSASLTTNHSQVLNKLKADTLYYYRVTSKDASGRSAVSDTLSFRTQAAPINKIKLFSPWMGSNPGKSATLGTSEHTGIAVANLSQEDAIVTFTAYERSGSLIRGEGIVNPAQRMLAAGAQLPIVDFELFGAGLAGRNPGGWIMVESTVAGVSAFTLIFDSNLSTLDGANVSFTPLTSFVFPEIEDQGFTNIHVTNPHDVPVTLNFELMQPGGSARATASRTLNPYGAMAEGLAELFPSTTLSAADYLKVSSALGVVPFQLFGKSGKYLEGLNGQAAGATNLYSPQYVVGGPWRSALSIVNLEGQAGNLTLRLVGENGAQIGATRTVPIAPYGKLHLTDQSFFGPGTGSITQGYVHITSSGPKLAGNVVFGDPAKQRFASALPLVSALQREFVFSQVASNETYFTGLALLNPGAADAVVTLDLYRSDGTREASVTETLPAKRRMSRLVTEFFPSLAGQSRSSGYIRVTSSQGLASFALFGTHDLSVLSAIPAQEIVK